MWFGCFKNLGRMLAVASPRSFTLRIRVVAQMPLRTGYQLLAEKAYTNIAKWWLLRT